MRAYLPTALRSGPDDLLGPLFYTSRLFVGADAGKPLKA
jgi:hypothetical protein